MGELIILAAIGFLCGGPTGAAIAVLLPFFIWLGYLVMSFILITLLGFLKSL